MPTTKYGATHPLRQIPPPCDTHPTNKQTARVKHGSMRSHPRSPPSTIRNIHANNQIRHHTCFGRYLHLMILHLTNEQTGPGQNTAAHAATPHHFDYLQHMRRQSKCGATHPLWR
ncbi:hypothetical protein BS47DRAFT_1369523, partial [Hydnum rufescens UP504]